MGIKDSDLLAAEPLDGADIVALTQLVASVYETRRTTLDDLATFFSGAVDHGATTGLGDDDHTQYHNDTRGDARYPLKSSNLSDLASASTARTNLGLGTLAVSSITELTADATPDGAADYVVTHDASAGVLKKVLLNDLPGGGGGVTDHGALTGLADNDHPQYALVANNLSDLANAATARTNLGLGTLATQSGTFSGTSSGTNTGDQTITLTGDVTGSGTGSFAATIANASVSLAKLANLAVDTIIGRQTAGTGVPEAIACTATGRQIIAATSFTDFRKRAGLWRWFEDFAQVPASTYSANTGSGTGGSAEVFDVAFMKLSDTFGAYTLTNGAGTATTDAHARSWNAQSFYLFDGMEAVFKVSLSHTTSVKTRFGFRTSSAATLWNDWTSGIYFEVDTDTSANYYMCAAVGGSRTKVDTGVAVTAYGYVEFKVTFTSSSSMSFHYWSGTAWVECTNSPITTNLPNTHATKKNAPHLVLAGSGAASRYLLVDYIGVLADSPPAWA